MIWSEINRMWKTYHQVSAWLASTSGLWVKHVKSENPPFCLPLKVPQTGFDGISSRQGNLIMVIKVINGHSQLLLRWVEFTNILVDPVADNSSEVDVINHPRSLVAGFMASHLKSIIFAQFAIDTWPNEILSTYSNIGGAVKWQYTIKCMNIFWLIWSGLWCLPTKTGFFCTKQNQMWHVALCFGSFSHPESM